MSFNRLPLLLGIGVLSIASCAKFERGERLPDAAPKPLDDGGGMLSFDEEVHPVLVIHCGECHSPGGPPSATEFLLTNDLMADYDHVLTFLNLDTPASSRLLSKGRGEGHGGGDSLPTSHDDYRLILNWITQGASR